MTPFIYAGICDFGVDPILRDQLCWPEATLKISPKNLSKNFRNKKSETHIESV